MTCGGGDSSGPAPVPTKLAIIVQPAATTTAGAVMSPGIRVAIQDAAGATVTGSTAAVSLAIVSGTGGAGATLGGTVVRNAANGVAIFDNLSINRAAAGYQLVASSGGLAAATSSAFAIEPGPPATLTFVNQPQGVSAGVAIAPVLQVSVQDALGNPVTGTAVPVTMSLTTAGSPVPGAVLGGTITRASANGVATFNDLTVNKAAIGFMLQAAAQGLPSALSNSFTVDGGPPAGLSIRQQPTTVAAGVQFTLALVIDVVDQFGNVSNHAVNPVTIGITPGTGPPGETLNGPTSLVASAGVALFNTISLTRTGTGTTLTASSPGLASVTTTPIAVTPGPAYQVTVETQPQSGIALQRLAPFTAAVRDALGNVVTNSSMGVGVRVMPGTGDWSATLAGTMSVATVSGIATFDSLFLDKAATGYQFQVFGFDLVPRLTSAFSITPGAARALRWHTQPPTTSVGNPFPTPPQVAVLDGAGNITDSTAVVTVAIAPGSGVAGATLSGTLARTSSGGLATFSDLVLDSTGGGYRLTASSPGFTTVTSTNFLVNAGPTVALLFGTQPSDAVSMVTMAPAVTVRVVDAAGNTDVSSSAPVTVTLTPANAAGATLPGSITTVAAVNGVARFANLRVDKAGSGYTLTASSPGLASDTSGTFSVQRGPPNHLRLAGQPANPLPAGTIIAPLTVSVHDSGGNALPVDGFAVHVAIACVLGCNAQGGTLFGTATRPTTAGVAIFDDLAIDRPGPYLLGFTGPNVHAVGTIAFDVIPSPATHLAFSQQPVTAAATIAMPPVTVRLLDSLGNVDTASTATVSVALTPGAGPPGAVLSGTLARQPVAGVVTFGDLSIDTQGPGFSLTVSAAGLPSITSATFAVASPLLTMTKVAGGDNQVALAGNPTNYRPAVLVTNGAGPVAGESVTFAITGGSGIMVGPATVTTNAQGIAQVGGWIVGQAAGANTLTATGAGSYAAGGTATFSATGQTAQYNIVIRNIGPAFSTTVQNAFTNAQTLWQSIIFGDVPSVPVNTSNACGAGVTINETVDDIIILARIDTIDGPGGILGQAGACSVRGDGKTVYGIMQFDVDDVNGLAQSGALNPVIVHEMGHVLGFSSNIWNFGTNHCAQDLSSGPAGSVLAGDTHFDCVHAGATNQARAVFDSIGGTRYTGGLKVPLENCIGQPSSCGPGTYNSHWRETTFSNELMTGYLNGTLAPLSVLTAASFADIGYVVNFAAAQAYTRTFTVAGAPATGSRLDLGNDLLAIPIIVVDAAGRPLRTIQPR